MNFFSFPSRSIKCFPSIWKAIHIFCRFSAIFIKLFWKLLERIILINKHIWNIIQRHSFLLFQISRNKNMAMLYKWIILVCFLQFIQASDIPPSADYIVGRDICSRDRNKLLCDSCNLMFGNLNSGCCEDASVFKKCLLAAEFGNLLSNLESNEVAEADILDESISPVGPVKLDRPNRMDKDLESERGEDKLEFHNKNLVREFFDPATSQKDSFMELEALRDKRRGVFLGKRRKIFLGKKDFVAGRSSGKRRNPFLGKRNAEKRKNPFLGKRGVIESTEN